MYSDTELQELYTTHVKLPPSYFTKYEMVPPCPVRAWDHSWKNYDFPRVWCILDFIEWIQKHSIQSIGHLGYTCEVDPELEFITAQQTTLVEYPPHDLHAVGTTYSSMFDLFLFNQTIEHLYNPFAAIQSIYTTVRPGGYVFTSVPTLNIPHMTPFHFGGYTPMGLAVMFKTANFEIVEMGQWGNYDYIRRLFDTHGWPGYDTLQQNGHVTNEERNVAQCWILARKPIDTSSVPSSPG